jgi:hypothetical protein
MEKLLSSGGRKFLSNLLPSGSSVFDVFFKLPRGFVQPYKLFIQNFWWGSKQG